jgi:hypothetical protein
MQGYEDTNDVFHLQNDPLFKDILVGDLASQLYLLKLCENSGICTKLSGKKKRPIFGSYNLPFMLMMLLSSG